MLYSYSGFPEHSWAIFERVEPPEGSRIQSPLNSNSPQGVGAVDGQATLKQVTERNGLSFIHETSRIAAVQSDPLEPKLASENAANSVELKVNRDQQVKMNTMSGLSIILTLMSILVAFRFVNFNNI